MFVNTGGGGKTQQQPLQNQTNASVRHNNPYPHSHTHSHTHATQQQQQQQQQQPHYEHHQGPVTFVTYPFCNVTPATHATTGANAVGVAAGQAGHVLYQTSHPPQAQPHPTQQVSLHNAEQTLHYFTKGAPMPAHHLHHPTQQHTQIRNMIAAVSHQRQPYMVSPNYFALSHTIQLPQQTRAPLLTNAAPQHPVAAASGGSMATQIQNTTPRSVAPSGPTAYVPPPYCTPPLLLGATPTAVTPQPTPMLTGAPGIGQPTTLQAYAHMGAAIPTGSTSATQINMPTVGLVPGVTTPTNTDHSNTNSNTKQRKHAIPIINPDTLEIVSLEHVSQSQQPQPKPEKIEISMEKPAMQNDNDNKSTTASVASETSDAATLTQSQSLSVTDTDKMEQHSIQNDQDDNINEDFHDNEEIDEDNLINSNVTEDEPENYEDNDDLVKTTSELQIETRDASIPIINTPTQSIHSASESPKMHFYEEDANDTDADTNEHELDNEEDGIVDTNDGNCSVACIDQELVENILEEEQPEISPSTDVVTSQGIQGESDSEHSTETEMKSKDEQCTVSVQTSLDRKVEIKSKEIQQDLPPTVSSFVANDTKRGRKNKKTPKRKDKNQKKSKQQQNKPNNNTVSTQNEDICNSHTLVKTIAADNKIQDLKNECIEEPRLNLIRYSLEELKALAKSPESRKTPVVPCQKGDCISQLFVARQQHHHHHHLSHQVGQNLNAMNLQHHVQQSYHHMNFNESMEFVTGKRRLGGASGTSGVGGGVGSLNRKHHDNHNIASSSGNINIAGLPSTSSSASGGGNNNQIQKKLQVIRIDLSLKEEIKLSKCENAWQPKFLSNNTTNNNSPTTEHDKNNDEDIEDVLKKVRGILNKLTAENFDVLLKEMTSITINTQEKMQKVMLLIFEKTVSEPNFAPTYAKFSKVLFEEVKAESKKVFNALLITRLQTEFELNVNNADAKERKLQQIINKLNETTDPQERIELQAELEHQEYQFRRRAWGTVRFIGEMYKLHSLSADRVLQCVESLLKHGNEEKLEYMCKLLTTVGNLLEGNDNESFSNSTRMNKIFNKIQAIVKEARDSNNKKVKICSRVRFMMQDLIDLRSRNWGQSTTPHNSHVALRRRHPDDRNSSLSSSNSMNAYDRGSTQRMSYGGNNNRHNQRGSKEPGGSVSGGNYFMQKPPKSQYLAQREQQSIDLKKLNFTRGDESSQATTKLGNSSIYMWRIASGRQTYPSSDSQQSERSSPTSLQVTQQYPQKQPQQQQQQAQYWNAKNQNSSTDIKSILDSCSHKDNQKLLNHLLEEYLDCLPSRSNRWREEVLNTWQKTNNKQQICLFYYILMDYLHLAKVKYLERNACAHIFIYLMSSDAFNKNTFARAYEQFGEEFPDLLMDVPNGWTYVFQFLGPLLHERLLSFSDIWQTNWRNDQTFTERFVNALVQYFTKEFGANYMRDLWHKEFKLDRGQIFMSDQQQWRQFVTNNKLQFLYDSKAKPEISTTNANNNSSTIMDQHVQRLQLLLLNSPNDSNLALDYINTNVNINTYFLKNLTRFLCCDYATTTMTTMSSRTSSANTSKNSSTCSNTSGGGGGASGSNSSTKNTDLLSNNNNNNINNNSSSSISNNANKKSQLNVNAFRKNCLPLLRLCLDAHEDHELTCLDSVVEAIQQEYDTTNANELICGIFDILYDCEVVAKESFEKWYKQRQQQQQQQPEHHKKNVVTSKQQQQQQQQIKRPLSAHIEAFLQKLL